MRNNTEWYGGIVWLVSSGTLVTYAALGLLDYSIPGVEELISFLTTTERSYLFVAALVAIFVEGLYVVGNFFPGGMLVLLLTILSQSSGMLVFSLTVATIFCGWTLAGVVNISLANLYRNRILKQPVLFDLPVEHKLLTTWFPSFRAPYEFAQVTEGAAPWRVLRSSLIVKAAACLWAGLVAYVMSLTIDVHNLSNEEGFISVFVVALICAYVGIKKLRTITAEQWLGKKPGS